MSQIRKVAILGGNRIPFMPVTPRYHSKSNMEMLPASLKGLVQRLNSRESV